MKKIITALCAVLLTACGVESQKTAGTENDYEVSVTPVQMTETSFQEITPIDNEPKKAYTWHIKPSIEAKHIDNIERSRTYYGDAVYDTSWYSRFFYVENGDGRKAVTDIDGNFYTDFAFDSMAYGFWGCILTDWHNNNEDNPWHGGYAACELYDDGTLSEYHYDEFYQEVTNGYGELYITDFEDDAYENRIVHYSDAIDNCIIGSSLCALKKLYLKKCESDYGFILDIWEDTRYDLRYGYENYTDNFGEKYALVSYIYEPKVVTDFIYEDKGNFINGIIPMKKDGKWGYLNRYGETVIPFEYDDAWLSAPDYDNYDGENFGVLEKTKARDASEYYVVLCKDNEYALYTTQYDEIIPFGEFDYITSVFQGKAWVRDKESGLWGVIGLNS